MASSTCSLYIPRAVCRFVVLSPALNTEITLVFLMEFGRLVLTSWRLSLKVPCPCHLRFSATTHRQGLYHHAMSIRDKLCHVKLVCINIPIANLPYLSCFSTKSPITIIKLGKYTKGTSLITSPPSEGKVNAAFSAMRLPLTSSFASFLCCRSLAMETLKDLNHL